MEGAIELEFQSLLWWIGRVNTVFTEADIPRAVGVSILVVVDWLRQHGPGTLFASLCAEVSILVVVDWLRQLEAPEILIGKRYLVSILVVVDWLRQPNTIPDLYRKSIGCFNPCCGGLAASTFQRNTSVGTSHVSILVVVDWLRQRHKSGSSAVAVLRFQSLLWWIGSRQRVTRLSAEVCRCEFQSLLWWIGCVNMLWPIRERDSD